METFHVKKPIYPLVSFVFSIIIFVFGLTLAKEMTLIYLFFGLTLLYSAFGYLKPLMKLLPPFALLGLLIGSGVWVTSGDPLPAIQTFGRILLLAYSSTPMVGTPPINLLRVFTQWGFPKVLSLGVLITLRFIPLLIMEMGQIFDAMKTRGIRLGFKERRTLYRGFMIPLLIRIAGMSDTMAISVETRGFSIEEKMQSVYRRIHFSLRDGIYIILLTLLMIGVKIYG